MTLRHLRIFVEVCRYGSVTKAAGKLYIAQPSVSLAIRELEDYYGVRLFDRIARRLHLTETGRQTLEYASHIVSLYDDMEKEIRDFGSRGVLRIGASITIGNWLLPVCVREFYKLYPKIRVQAVIDNTAVIEASALDNSIDFAVVEGNIHNKNIVQEVFREDELVPICGREHPLRGREDVCLKDLSECEFLLRERGSAGREIFDGVMNLHGIEITPLWQSASTQAIVRAVAAGLGISVLPRLFVEKDINEGNVFPLRILDASFTRQFSVIRHKNKMITQPAAQMIRLCKEWQPE